MRLTVKKTQNLHIGPKGTKMSKSKNSHKNVMLGSKYLINLNRLCSEFEDDISKNELSVRFCLGAVPDFPHWMPAKLHW